MDIKECFVIMPITTPNHLQKQYSGEAKHFEHVFKCLFEPAIEKAGFKPHPPSMDGSVMIRPEIIKKLSEADLVLCDLSILNPNVFFELGIRTALNKPVILVKDEKTGTIPFDIIDINCHPYSSSLQMWEAESEIDKLCQHIEKSKSHSNNQMWKYFGVSVAASQLEKQPDEIDKIEYLIAIVEEMTEKQKELLAILNTPTGNTINAARIDKLPTWGELLHNEEFWKQFKQKGESNR